MNGKLTRRSLLILGAAAPTAVLLAACGAAASRTATSAPTQAPTGVAPTAPPPTATRPAAATPSTAPATARVATTAAPPGAAATPASPTPADASARTTAPASTPTQPASAQSAAAAAPACVLRPAQTEGPYFVDEKLNRSDIRVDPSDGSVKPGVPLSLTLRVLGVSGSACVPVQGATVDLWHCDALGVYSDVADPSFNTKGKKFLRGYQTTDKDGLVTFQTIYPGWYQGRAVHIHFKIRTNPGAAAGHELTSQLYFDDALSAQVYTQQPYATKGTRGLMKNDQDGIFRDGGGQLLLSLTKSGDGYTTAFDVGLRLT